MDITAMLCGFDEAAVFGVNIEATQQQIEAGQRDAKVYGEAVDKLIAKVGLRPGYYAREQAIFGPIIRMMGLAGWTFSGSGFFSICFYKDGLAIKLSLRGSGDSAIDFAEWASEQDLPHLPTIHAVGRFGHAAVVLMERYEQVSHRISYYGDEYDEELGYEFEAAKNALNTGTVFPDSSIGETAYAIRKRFEGLGQFDLHDENVMIDRNGNLILTDPLGRSKERSTRYGGYTGSNDDNYYVYDTQGLVMAV